MARVAVLGARAILTGGSRALQIDRIEAGPAMACCAASPASPAYPGNSLSAMMRAVTAPATSRHPTGGRKLQGGSTRRSHRGVSRRPMVTKSTAEGRRGQQIAKRSVLSILTASTGREATNATRIFPAHADPHKTRTRACRRSRRSRGSRHGTGRAADMDRRCRRRAPIVVNVRRERGCANLGPWFEKPGSAISRSVLTEAVVCRLRGRHGAKGRSTRVRVSADERRHAAKALPAVARVVAMDE